MSYPNSLKSCSYDPDSLIFQGLDKSLLIAAMLLFTLQLEALEITPTSEFRHLTSLEQRQ